MVAILERDLCRRGDGEGHDGGFAMKRWSKREIKSGTVFQSRRNCNRGSLGCSEGLARREQLFQRPEGEWTVEDEGEMEHNAPKGRVRSARCAMRDSKSARPTRNRLEPTPWTATIPAFSQTTLSSLQLFRMLARWPDISSIQRRARIAATQ